MYISTTQVLTGALFVAPVSLLMPVAAGTSLNFGVSAPCLGSLFVFVRTAFDL